MAERHIETVRALYEDWADMDGEERLALFATDIVWRPVPQGRPEARTYEGHDGLMRWRDEVRTAFSSFEPVPIAFEERGGSVVVETRWRGRGIRSGIEVEVVVFHVWTLVDGLVTRFEAFLDRADARAAALA